MKLICLSSLAAVLSPLAISQSAAAQNASLDYPVYYYECAGLDPQEGPSHTQYFNKNCSKIFVEPYLAAVIRSIAWLDNGEEGCKTYSDTHKKVGALDAVVQKLEGESSGALQETIDAMLQKYEDNENVCEYLESEPANSPESAPLGTPHCEGDPESRYKALMDEIEILQDSKTPELQALHAELDALADEEFRLRYMPVATLTYGWELQNPPVYAWMQKIASTVVSLGAPEDYIFQQPSLPKEFSNKTAHYGTSEPIPGSEHAEFRFNGNAQRVVTYKMLDLCKDLDSDPERFKLGVQTKFARQEAGGVLQFSYQVMKPDGTLGTEKTYTFPPRH